MNNQEKRFHSSDFEVRTDSDKTIVEGYAARFDDETVIGGKFSERVARGAFDNADMSNVVALFNHDWNMPLARTGKGLELSVDEIGLRYRFELGDQSYAKDLAENIRMGNVSTSSFGFTVADDSWERRDNGVNLRTIDSVGTLFDVSPTTQGAYPTTEVALRSMEAALEVEVPVLEEVAIEVEEVEEVVIAEEVTEEVVAEEVVEVEEEETEEVRAEDAPADDTEDEPKDSDEEEEDEEEEQPIDNNNSEPEARNLNPIMENNLNAAPAVVQSLGDTEVRTASNFDFGKFLKEAAKGQVSGLEAEMIQEGNNEMRNAGVNASGGFSIPTMVLRSMGVGAGAAGNTAFGGGIAKDDHGIVADYAPSDLASKLGIRNMTGLSGDVAMQVQSTLTAATGGVTEGAAQAEALPVFGEVVLSPTRYAANVGVTQQMLAQSGDDMAAFIQMDIRRALDKQFNAALITEIEANDAALAYATNNPLDVEAVLLGADVDLNDVRFIASANGYREMRKLSFDAGSGDLFAGSPVSRKAIAGYMGEISSQATSQTINFFDNKQIVTGTWGGLNLIVDPYTDAHKGIVRIVANEYRDVEALNTASFQTLTGVGA